MFAHNNSEKAQRDYGKTLRVTHTHADPFLLFFFFNALFWKTLSHSLVSSQPDSYAWQEEDLC